MSPTVSPRLTPSAASPAAVRRTRSPYSAHVSSRSPPCERSARTSPWSARGVWNASHIVAASRARSRTCGAVSVVMRRIINEHAYSYGSSVRGREQEMREERASINGIELCYETFGVPDDPALLLIMGLGGQMIWWDDDLCRLLAAEGYYVIRFDNRDCGRSTVLHDAPLPKPRQLRRRDPRAAAYSLDDMASDAVGLLDHLGIRAAHVAGVSMGGMIAQALAIRYPQRVLSLCSISSTTGDPSVGKTKWRLYPVLFRPLPKDRAPHIDAFARMAKKIGSGRKLAPDIEQVRDLAGRSFDRGFHPEGTQRQFAAAVTAPNRTPLLRDVRVPTLVIHGDADGLVNASGGRATAEAIPDAKLVLIKGMAHDMPRPVWPQLVSEITGNA